MKQPSVEGAGPPRSSLKEKQRREREDLIMQVAEEVIMEKGYRETSIDEIAARVGIAKGTVYLHFPSKEDLIIALFARDMQQLLEQVDAIAQGGGTARTRLETVLTYIYGTLFVKRITLFYSMYDDKEAHQQLVNRKAALKEQGNSLAEKLTGLLEEGKAAGEFDRAIPTRVMLGSLFSLLSPWSYERLLKDGELTRDELIVHLSRLFFRGITVG